MTDSWKLILQKLNEIDSRLKALEGAKIESSASPVKKETKQKVDDPLLPEVIKMLDEYDELSTAQLEKKFNIEKERAEQLLDQLEEKGLGVCYFKEV